MPIIKIKDDGHWHKLRQETIGGSEVAIVFGISSYSTSNELYHVKRGNYKEDLDGSKLMQWGKAMEPVIAAFISGEMHWDLKPCREYHTHPEHPHLGATLDYHVVESEHGPGILEIKNVSTFAPNWTNERAPAYVELQLQHQFLVVNAARIAEGLDPYRWGAIGSMHAGNPEDIRIMYRKPDPKVHEHIIKQCGEWWAAMKAGEEPDLIGEKEYEHIAEMFVQAEPRLKTGDLDERMDDDELDDLMAAHEFARESEALHKKEKAALKAKILRHLLLVDEEGVTREMTARTKNYAVETSVIEVTRKAQPTKTGTQLRFKIREVL